MTQLTTPPLTSATMPDGTATMNGTAAKAAPTSTVKRYPQTTFQETVIDPNSFYGSLRAVFADKVLKTQLDQLKKQGSYDAFQLKWHPAYDVRPLHGANARDDGIPPSLFWESDSGGKL